MTMRLAVMAGGPGSSDALDVTYCEPDESNPNEPSADPPRAPSVTDEVRRNLLRSRTVLIFGEIDSALAQATTAQLLALASDSDAPIRIVLHSPLEADYHDSLHRFLRKRAPQLQVERERPINAVIEGTRRRLDLAIDGRVVIELKRHLRKTADADRAYGQIRGYAQAWPHGPVLLVLCETSDDFAQQRGLQNKIEELRAANYAVVAIAAGRRARA